jgi:S-adenosylmethionine:tRNA ribosyltransferase-isomerase
LASSHHQWRPSPTSRTSSTSLLLSDYDYDLPPRLIAQHPLGDRTASRLLHLQAGGRPAHLNFTDLPRLLRPGDLLVVNETRVIPARLLFDLEGAPAEVLLLHPLEPDRWEALVRPGRRLRRGATAEIRAGLRVVVEDELPQGRRMLRFEPPGKLAEVHEVIGVTPLPPYIHEPLEDPERYQTVYARVPGSAAAPTAGLHFSQDSLDQLRAGGVVVAPLTLRIGLDTFRPVRVEDLDHHQMHSEKFAIPAGTVVAVEACRAAGGRVVAVGTTVARALETWAHDGRTEGDTDLFIRPGFDFQAVDLLLTNFHLPRSTLLVLVSAFAGRERVLAAYREAVAREYRFFSFGDAMLLERA